jgi:hypothetical protein
MVRHDDGTVMTAHAAAWLAALTAAGVILVSWSGRGEMPLRRGGRGPVRGRVHRKRHGKDRGIESSDPLPDDVAAEALGQAVALLKAGVPVQRLFGLWGSTRATESLGSAGTVWLGEKGQPSALTRKGRTRVRRETLKRAWLSALAAADLQMASGGELKDVAGPGRGWRETVWAVGLSVGTGAPLSDLLERVRDECTARADAARARTAGLAAARTTRRILMGLPAGGLLLAQALGAHPLHILFQTFWGRAALILGGGFWLVAVMWSRHILKGGMKTS